jgi:hypothetical protein
MARYIAHTCPKCKSYLGIVIPLPEHEAMEIPIEGNCLGCGYKLAWKVILGRRSVSALTYGQGQSTINLASL